MNITRDEVVLHLNKWLEERTLLNVCFSIPGVHAQCCFGGHVTKLAENLVFSHPKGNSEAYLSCTWEEVERCEYIELREAADRLDIIPGAAEFMRERTNLILVLRGSAVILLTDLS